MKIVIDIPKGAYEEIVNAKFPVQDVYRLVAWIKNGTPLPKGHGRLGDLDALEKEIVNGIKAGNYEEGYDTFAHINDMDDCVECVRYTPTIIKADKKERPDNICTQRCCLKNHNIGIIECDEECSNRTSF